MIKLMPLTLKKITQFGIATMIGLSSLQATFADESQKMTWEELKEKYQVPEWYKDAKFGVWAHWGAQTQPARGGGWYARNMYLPTHKAPPAAWEAFEFHREIYGHQSEFGYKDIINTWKAENLDTDELLKYFKSIGAKYFVALANHHDHFDNFDSTHHDWNSVNMGPKKDIIGLFSKSAEKYGMPFGVSSHDDRHLGWFRSSFGSDKEGKYKGVPYDGHMTKEDGKGKWWEGYDPADLYGLPPAKRTPEWVAKVKTKWELRHKELLTKYKVDMVWFDGYGFPHKENGKEVCREFFEHSLKENGKIDVVITAKIKEEPNAVVRDIEKGVSPKILPQTWQSITTLSQWFYKEDGGMRQNSNTIIERLVDVVSKNGNLLLNIGLKPDGTLPRNQKHIFDDIGLWLGIYGDAIYGSKPWKIFGDNLNSVLKTRDNKDIQEADLKALQKHKKKGHFNERDLKSPPYGKEEVRFTVKGDKLYLFVLNPRQGQIKIPSLGLNSEHNKAKIQSLKMMGSSLDVKFEQKEDGLYLMVPAKRPTEFVTGFEITGLL